MSDNPGSGRQDVVLFIGSRASSVMERVEDRLTVPCRLLHRGSESGTPPLLTVLCPSDIHELSDLESWSVPVSPSGGEHSAVIMEDPGEAIHTAGRITLADGDFACRLLADVGNRMRVPIVGTGEISLLTWLRTGSLMPFFIHNMNNILARIMGNIELADLYIGDKEKQKNKLEVALEASDDLRHFLRTLSTVISPEPDNNVHWLLGDETAVFELGCLASGTSVEFSRTSEGSIPGQLPVSRGILNSITGILSACAIISVGGCGKVNFGTVGLDQGVSFIMEWSRPEAETDLSGRNTNSVSELMASGAVIACRSRLSFLVGEWNTCSGSASVSIQLADENENE